MSKPLKNPIKFNAQIEAFVPGNFVSWRIIEIPGEKHPTIEDDYTLDGIEVIFQALGISVESRGFAYVPVVNNYAKLDNAVFEIEKTAPKCFRVVRYVGTVEVQYKIKPGHNTTPPESKVNRVIDQQEKPTSDRFSSLELM
jgi:hypothetical protein